MTFDRRKDSPWLTCSLQTDKHEQSFDKEDRVERQQRLSKLRSQIRNGTYRPSIGEIAISLIKGTMSPESFR